jgi:aspartokinase-like uncharacterized kinase
MPSPCSRERPDMSIETGNDAPSVSVVKVGGSLFDLPDLGTRLQCWLETVSPARVVLVPGGGTPVDIVRAFDQQHRLDETTAHWLAIRAMSLNARLLEALLAKRSEVVPSWEACQRAWRQGTVPIMDVHGFLETDEGNPGCLPHSWSVTSDSIAARFAVVHRARELILLKSITIPQTMDWPRAAQMGFVDAHFPKLMGGEMMVRAINFREWRA